MQTHSNMTQKILSVISQHLTKSIRAYNWPYYKSHLKRHLSSGFPASTSHQHIVIRIEKQSYINIVENTNIQRIILLNLEKSQTFELKKIGNKIDKGQNFSLNIQFEDTFKCNVWEPIKGKYIDRPMNYQTNKLIVAFKQLPKEKHYYVVTAYPFLDQRFVIQQRSNQEQIFAHKVIKGKMKRFQEQIFAHEPIKWKMKKKQEQIQVHEPNGGK